MVTVRNKYTGEEIAEIEDTDLAGGAEEALRVAVRAFREVSSMPAYRRRDCLYSVSEYLRSREVEFARTISMEAGKPIRYARKEVRRAEFTIRSSGDEAMRIHGETVPFDVEPRGGEGRFAYFVRVPIGPVLSITPFNDPLNLLRTRWAPPWQPATP
ncbi:aldehyde dehydrogenase family protein [Thermogymnomonas acidicola]|uniref:aldehyde dehydrogenase family protein n=1 Tax=Thermogymnomonas acidicola TaxID=399579 RepID=UPI001396A103|nr:aldehyde dehydrogenase family protein [Thermogymnomonas acidicola]